MTTIASLPPELFNGICHDFELPDLCALRLTCKALKLRTTEFFAKRVFRTTHVALTSDGMQFLQKIAAHEFRQYVQKLWIVLDLFRGYHNWSAEEFARQQHYNLCKSPKAVGTGYEYITPPETPIEARYAIYQGAVADYLHTHNTLRKTLESCLPCFPSLEAVGLWNSERHVMGFITKERMRRKIRGVGKLKRQLGFDPLHLETIEHQKMDPRNGAAILSTLLNALATTNTRIKTLYTNGGDQGGILVDTRPHLTATERGLLTPILHGLQDMRLRIWPFHKEDYDDKEGASSAVETHRETIMSVLAEAAPSLDSLGIGVTFVMRGNQGLETVDKHIDWLSRHFYFRRLSNLILNNVVTNVPLLEALLKSALPTLRKLQLWAVNIASDHIFSPESIVTQGVKLWKQLFVFLRDNSSLRDLDLRDLRFQRKIIGMNDPVHGSEGLKPLVCSTDHAHYRETVSDITFRQWIDQVELRAFSFPRLHKKHTKLCRGRVNLDALVIPK